MILRLVSFLFYNIKGVHLKFTEPLSTNDNLITDFDHFYNTILKQLTISANDVFFKHFFIQPFR